MDDVDALSTIVGVLKRLDEDAQKRVLASVSAFLGLGNTPQGRSDQFVNSAGAGVTSSVSESAFSTDRSMSPKEFLRDKQPITDVERVACLGYYLAHYRGTQHFKTLDISSINVEAAQPKFSNAAAAVDNARAKGFLVPSLKGSKQLSAAAERYVELLPDREAARASFANSAKRSARKSKQKITK